MASPPSDPAPVHLVVMCHGLWGEPKHLYTLEALLEQSFGSRATVARPPQKTSPADEDAKSKKAKQQRRQQEQPKAKALPQVKTPASAEAAQASSSTTASSASSSVDVVEETLGKGVDRVTTRQKIEHPRKRFSKSEEEFLLPYTPAERIRKSKQQASSQTGTDTEDELMDVVILNTSSNEGSKTYDGIDWLAERVVREIKDEQELLAEQGKHIARFSMMGYSLGGLVVRCTIGLLEADGFFSSQRIQTRQVVTIACPHIGSPQGAGTFGRIVKTIGSRLLSRTGEQLYGMDSGWESVKDDKAGTKVGLLECMARPESVFIRGLRRFERITFYANAVNDVTVPFRTGCIEEWDPFVEKEGHVNVKMIEGAPLITSIEVGEVPPKTLVESVQSSLTGFPAFLNPNRLPFGFPYNYILVIGSPILLPLGLIRIILRLSKDSKRSRLRIKDLERDSSSSSDETEEGQGRIARLVRKSVGEGVEEFRAVDPISDEHAELAVKPDLKNATSVERESLIKDFQRSAWQHDDTLPPPKKQPPLSDAQKTAIRNLNNPDVLPHLTKIWAYFPDQINAHGTIIARTLSMAPQRRGLPIIKHVVDNFLA